MAGVLSRLFSPLGSRYHPYVSTVSECVFMSATNPPLALFLAGPAVESSTGFVQA